MPNKTRHQHLYYEHILTNKIHTAIMIFQNEEIEKVQVQSVVSNSPIKRKYCYSRDSDKEIRKKYNYEQNTPAQRMGAEQYF